MFKSIFLPIIGVALFIIVVGLLSQGKFDSTLKKAVATPLPNTKFIKIDSNDFSVEIARTDDEKSKGLSNRSSLNEKSGMIFIFQKNSKVTFWMKDTLIPLDIIWINDDKVVGIEKNVPTEIGKSNSELKRYSPNGVVDYVLELNAGASDKYGIKVGQTIYGLEQL